MGFKFKASPLYPLLLLISLGFGACTPPYPTQTIFLVRHAEKVLADTTDNPPLLPAGRERALKLKEMMQSEKINAIYSTRYNRNLETVKPLADALGITINLYEWHDWKPMLNNISNRKKGHFLICGHGDNLLPMIEYLGGKRPLDSLGNLEYDKIFKVERGKEVKVSVSIY